MSELQEKSANPAPLGLAGFGMSTILLNIHNAGFFELNIMVLSMGILYGGGAQIIAGLMEFKKGNTFGVVAFTSYGIFWFSLVAILVFEHFGFMPTSSLSMAWYLVVWGIFTFGLFLATLNGSSVGKMVFFLTTILFLLLAGSVFFENNELKIIAGYEGILCGSLALYEAFAQIINEKYERAILPM